MTIYEKWERADNEVFRLSEAYDHLKGVRDCTDLMDIIKDRMIVTAFEREQYHKLLEEQNRREDEELRREYELATI